MLPQIIYLSLTMLGLGMQAVKHGNPKEGKENFWVVFISTAISVGLLYWGGFFDVFNN